MADSIHGPTFNIPSNPISQIDQNSDLWPIIIAISVITSVFATFSVVIRIYVKSRIYGELKWEEYLVVCAVTILVAWTILFDVNCRLGVSKHQWNVRPSAMPKIMNLLNVSDLLLGPMMGTAKFALILQIRRNFPKNEKNTLAIRCGTYATMIVVAGYYFAAIFIVAFQCTPRRGIWDPTANAQCINTPIAVYTEGSFALLTDIMIFVLFACLIKVAGARQLGGLTLLTTITVAGLLGIACSSASLYFRTPFVRQDPDITYKLGRLQLWAMVEYTMVIIAGCVPSIGYLVQRRKGRVSNQAEHVVGRKSLSTAAE